MKKNTKTTLDKTNRDLARDWHPTKNAPLTLGDVTPGSHKKVWWVCRKGHEWEALISNRSKGSGCPYCAGLRVSEDNCLQTVNPKLAREWHPMKNVPLTPKDVTAGSEKKVWWICKQGHEWAAIIYTRNRPGRGCPYCAGQKANKENCLRTINPKLAREWHPTKNVSLTPKDVTDNSHKKVWWMCRRGHEWKTSISHRTRGDNCPFCSGRKVNNDNCLQTLNPGLAKEWHPFKNAPLTPHDVTVFSNKKIWWVCRKGHEWKTSISTRSNGTGCPYCAGRKVNKDNCLQSVRPGLAKEWHPTKNAPLTPKDITLCSNKKVWWRCRKGHEWNTEVSNRSKGLGCPFCSGRRPTKEHSLVIRGSWLAREWHPAKNGAWMPRDVAPHSERQVWWNCRKGHEQREKVIDRYKRGGCPVCVLKARAPRLFGTTGTRVAS